MSFTVSFLTVGENSMKNIFLLTVPLILMLLPWLSVSFAENHIPDYLPDGAIARFGKGFPFDFSYASDGTKLAVASTIGIWIYDTRAGYQELDLLTYILCKSCHF